MWFDKTPSKKKGREPQGPAITSAGKLPTVKQEEWGLVELVKD